MAQHKVTCFWAEQETHYDMEKTVSVKTESDAVKVAVITTENKIVTDSLDAPADATEVQIDDDVSTYSDITSGLSLAQLSSGSEVQMTESARNSMTSLARTRQSSKRFNAHMDHRPSLETDLAISFINSQDLGWKADVCKLSQTHSDYGSHCEQGPLSLAQVSSSKNDTAQVVNKTAAVQEKSQQKAQVKTEASVNTKANATQKTETKAKADVKVEAKVETKAKVETEVKA